jgi:hypothetical protein
VVDAQSGEPVRKAIVVLREGKEPGTGTLSDAAGRFNFRDIPPAAYTFTIERQGFVTDPKSEHLTVLTKPGETESDITIKLIKTGALSGRVLDADGEPVTGASVQILSVQARASWYATTDDRGAYRAYGIKPGKYRIAASDSHERSPTVKKMVPASEEPYATTYYPSALDKRRAAVVGVDAGADLEGFEIHLLRTKGVRVRGRVSGPGGASPGAFVAVLLRPTQVPGQDRDVLSRDSKGEFEITQVPPGSYVISALAPIQDQKLSASRIIEVEDTDLDGVQLALASPQKIIGRVLIPENRKMPEGLVGVLASRQEDDRLGSGAMAEVDAKGGFTFAEVQAGDYDVVVGTTGTGDDLYISAIRVGDQDVLAEGLHVDGSQGALEIVLKPNGGTVQCSVKNAEGQPVPDAHVRLLPDPPRRGQMALHAECEADASGKCTLLGVAPGAYHGFAFTSEPQIDFRRPEATKDFEDAGKAVKVAESDTQQLALSPVLD